jgi:GNAT superfamily N-acetyltransferase
LKANSYSRSALYSNNWKLRSIPEAVGTSIKQGESKNMKTTKNSHFTGNHMTDQQNENPQNQGAAELQSGTDDSSSIRCFRLQDSSTEIPDLEALNLEAFPSSEYMSIPEMIRVCRVIGGEALAWYYRGELAGFSQSLVNRHTAYHTYLAIMPSMRSHGLGQKIIARIIARNLPRQSVLDFEFLDPARKIMGSESAARRSILETVSTKPDSIPCSQVTILKSAAQRRPTGHFFAERYLPEAQPGAGDFWPAHTGADILSRLISLGITTAFPLLGICYTDEQTIKSERRPL